MQHRFSRTELLIGREGLERLGQSHVAVFGLGGVGSYTVEALARTGIGRLTLVDYDEICITNINRQLHALSDTIGRPKVDVMAERIQKINPRARVSTVREFYGPETASRIPWEELDYVVDAVDTVSAKVSIIDQSINAGRGRVVSCLGTGNKFDPTLLTVCDISETHTCPLAKAVRSALRKRGILSGVKVVFSPERPVSPRPEVPDCHDRCVCPGGATAYNCLSKRQIPGSMSYVPPVAGMIAASVVVNDLLGITASAGRDTERRRRQVGGSV